MERFSVTINGADNVMVARLTPERDDGSIFYPVHWLAPIYEIEPSLLFEVLEGAIGSGWVDIKEVDEDICFLMRKDGG